MDYMQHGPTYRPVSFELDQLQVNPDAAKAGKRYLDRDIQDFFSDKMLKAPTGYDREHARAKTVAKKIGDPDTLIDLHTTDAEGMGITLNVSRWTPQWHAVLGHMEALHPEVHILYTPEQQGTSPYLDSLATNGLTVELGGVGHNTHDSRATWKLAVALELLLKLIDAFKQGKLAEPSDYSVFKQLREVLYPEPRKDWKVADGLKGLDYTPLRAGTQVFRNIKNGKVITYSGAPTYPVFIDETAYDCEEEGWVAFDLTELTTARKCYATKTR